VAIYVTGISTPEFHLESPPLLGTLTSLISTALARCHRCTCRTVAFGTRFGYLSHNQIHHHWEAWASRKRVRIFATASFHHRDPSGEPSALEVLEDHRRRNGGFIVKHRVMP
jgi:hypothetical protein